MKASSLKKTIYNVLKESIDFNDYLNPSYITEKDKPEAGNSDSESDKTDNRVEDTEADKTTNKRRAKVMAFLKSAQQKHSEYAYHLWPDMDEDDARSLFSKKYRGHDAEGKPYSFNNEEINNIYNLIDDVLEKTKW